MTSYKMIKRLFGSVTIPPRPRPGMDALTFAQGVWKALDQIRGMTYDTGPSAKRQSTPPGRLVLIKGTAANKLKVTVGTINTQTPTLGGTALSADPAPEITVSADIWVWAKVVGVFSGPSYTITIETSATSSPPSGTAISTTGFTSYRLIGSATFADSAATIVDNRQGGDLFVDSFGSANFWWLA